MLPQQGGQAAELRRVLLLLVDGQSRLRRLRQR